MLMKMLIILLMNMISVGFFTLVEQKILGYMNNRLGPNKIFIMGLIQFISDLVKLIFKDNIYLYMFNFFSFYFFLFIFFSLSLMLWIFVPLLINMFNLKFFFFIHVIIN